MTKEEMISVFRQMVNREKEELKVRSYGNPDSAVIYDYAQRAEQRLVGSIYFMSDCDMITPEESIELTSLVHMEILVDCL